MIVSFRFTTAVFAALATAMTPGAVRAQPQSPATAITCTNPASGATWQISIDFAKATVDAKPARISDNEISWHDPSDNGNYTLDRKSGELTIIMPSSTGGYFLHDHCRLPP
jgi:hypothetical protein